MKKKKQRYTYPEINEVFEKLMSQTHYLSKHYEDKKNTAFYEEDLPYVDIEILFAGKSKKENFQKSMSFLEM